MSRIPIAISTCMSRSPAAAQEMTGSFSNHFPAAETMDGHLIKRQKPYGSTYQKDLERLFSGIIGPLKKGDRYAWCVPCARDITIYASGVNDLREHLKTKLHARNDKEFGSAFNDVTFHFKRQSVDVPDSVTTAEVLFSFFVAEHNLPANVSNHFTDRSCGSSRIAPSQKISGVNERRQRLAPIATDIVTKQCRDGRFSVNNGRQSTNQNMDKGLAILLGYFAGETHTRVLDMPGKEIFDCMDGVFLIVCV